MILLDLFCGRWGWSRAFAKRGWHCIGVDLTKPPEIPEGCEFIQADVLGIKIENGIFIITDIFGVIHRIKPDAIVASSPCEKFSVFGMRHFHPNPPHPESGIRLFEHTRALCEASGLPYVMENVRAAQQFVGNAVHHCGPFYLWGNAVPPLVHRGIIKGWGRKWIDSKGRVRDQGPTGRGGGKSNGSDLATNGEFTARAATIPPELANTVADYMERMIELRDSRGVQPGYASPSTTAKHPGLNDGGAREISLLRRRPTGDLKIAPFCTLPDSPRSMQQLS